MSDISTNQVRTLLRLIAPLRSLNKDVEQSLHMDTFRGTSKLVMKNYHALQTTVATIINDDYVHSLALDVDEDATEHEIIAQVSLAVGQLLAYVESYSGVPSSHGRHSSIQTAPQITINAAGASEENKERIMNLVRDTLKNEQVES